MASANLLDIAKISGNDKLVGIIEEVGNVAPEVMAIPARTIRGTSYKISSRLTNPGVGFRNANEGWTLGASTYFSRNIETKIFGGAIQCDKAVANAYEDGAEKWKSLEAAGVAQQAMIELGQQTFQGTATDAKGFPGLKQIHEELNTLRVAAGLTEIEVDAAGTSAGTSSSVYMIRTGDQGVQYIYGAGEGFTLGEWREQQVTASSLTYDAYVNSLTAWAGLQVGSIHSVGRIWDLTEDTNCKLTDAFLWQLFHKFPIGQKPNMVLMSRRSSQQLQISRTVTINASGSTRAGNNVENIPAPATDWNGLPIIVTDSIPDNDALNNG